MTPRTAELQKDYREDEEALQFATGAWVRDTSTAPLKPAKGWNGPPHGGITTGVLDALTRYAKPPSGAYYFVPSTESLRATRGDTSA